LNDITGKEKGKRLGEVTPVGIAAQPDIQWGSERQLPNSRIPKRNKTHEWGGVCSADGGYSKKGGKDKQAEGAIFETPDQEGVCLSVKSKTSRPGDTSLSKNGMAPLAGERDETSRKELRGIVEGERDFLQLPVSPSIQRGESFSENPNLSSTSKGGSSYRGDLEGGRV